MDGQGAPVQLLHTRLHLPPLTKTHVEFVSYKSNFSKGFALQLKVNKMLGKGALKVSIRYLADCSYWRRPWEDGDCLLSLAAEYHHTAYEIPNRSRCVCLHIHMERWLVPLIWKMPTLDLHPSSSGNCLSDQGDALQALNSTSSLHQHLYSTFLSWAHIRGIRLLR